MGTNNRPRVAIVSTHPIQYHTPWYRALADRPEVETVVLYCHKATAQEQSKAGFGIEFDWDVSLLDGYQWEFLGNVSQEPAVTFWGLDTPELAGRIGRREFDAVVLNGWHYKSAWQAMYACWRSGTPVMVRSDSHLKSPRHPVKTYAKWPFYRLFIPRLDSCLPVGIWSREYFLHYGADPHNVFEVPHIIDLDRFGASAAIGAEERNELRRKWGLSPEKAVFLYAGKFIEKKRPMDFVRSIRRANQLGAQVSGLMVGDGALRLCHFTQPGSGHRRWRAWSFGL